MFRAMSRGGYPPVPAYTDIAHFRAPYKDVELTGMSGCCGLGFEEDVIQMLTAGLSPAELQGYTEDDEKGWKHWRSDYAKGIKERLSYSSTAVINDNIVDVSLVVTSDAEKKALEKAGQSGLQWLKRKLKEGKIVLASTTTLGTVGTAQLVAMDPADVDGIRNASQVAPVLAEPMKLSAAMMTAGGAVLFVLVGGALILASRKRRPSYLSNPPPKKKRTVKKATKKATKKRTTRKKKRRSKQYY